MNDAIANLSERFVLSSEEAARKFVSSRTDGVAMERLDRFAELLLAENEQQNLVSKSSETQLWVRHFADSVQLLDHVSRETIGRSGVSDDPQPWLDLGTGAGFPGLVIAAVMPDLPMILVESRSRRAEFLKHCIRKLGLTHCTVVAERLERIAPFPVSVISARAFAPLEKLLRLSAPFSTKATRYLLPKGRSAAHELSEQKASIRAMFHVEHSLTDHEAGIIVSN